MQNTLKDCINRISVSQKFFFLETELISSKIVYNFLKFLYKEGFIRGFKKEKKKIIVYLKYSNNKPVISYIKNISTKNKRVYMSYSDVLKCSNLKETLVLLTPQGFFSSKNCFDSDFSGGEVVCKIF